MFPPAGTYSVPVMKMKRRILILPVLLFALALLRFPQEAAQAVREGLLLCFETVVPSLFPFFVVVSLLIQLGAAGALQRLFTPFMGPLFHLRGLCAAPLIAGLVGGYPAGARTAAELVRSGQLSREEGERCLGFVNNCGPAFILSYVGAGILHSSRAGVWLYLIHVLSALLTGMLLCRLLPEYGFERAGVFPFSCEEGTPAADMPDQVDPEEARRRAERLTDIQSRIMDRWNEDRLGEPLEVLCEGFDPDMGCYMGRSYADSVEIDNHVYFTAAGLVPAGEFVNVRITGTQDGDLTGEIEE